MKKIQVAIAGLCRDAGALFKCGVATQIGSACGALTAFLLVNQVRYFYISSSRWNKNKNIQKTNNLGVD